MKQGTAGAARARLAADQALRPLVEQRVRLAVLARRLDQAGRSALMQEVASRVRGDRRFAPVFGQLVGLALNSELTTKAPDRSIGRLPAR